MPDENTQEIAEYLADVAALLNDPSTQLGDVGDLLYKQTGEVWQTEGGILGEDWPPLSPNTREATGELLVASGALQASLSDEGAVSIEGELLSFGTDVPYAVYHQYGTERMPERPVVAVTETVTVLILRAFIQAYEDAFMGK